ncbi:hypothetical protein B0H67DRAFT_642042 [Lasiosphaeris hirsuta]|uniref:DUF7924 domain-containing protein n=1 Tax=Lasiosphaeris hirsuta TaxID=260670 RepID=A0AA40B0X9_9PEZI|nr:hypothetical protein B0H67DRAFT_642042 [Lasiosphaeris hirsuta]
MADIRSLGYRSSVLDSNGVYFQLPSNPLPHTVVLQTNQLFTQRPTPTSEMLGNMINELDRLGTRGGNEAAVVTCFSNGRLFPVTLPTALYVYSMAYIGRHLIPDNPNTSDAIPQPRPDLMYGYPIQAFTQTQRGILARLHAEISRYSQAYGDLCFPFLVVEVKAAAGTRGDHWVAANQCAGGSAACLQALNQLNLVVGEAGCLGQIPNFCYSLVIDNNLGQLYVSWEDGGYHIQRVASFLVSDPDHLARLYWCFAAILEWGVRRLGEVRAAVDYINQQTVREAP